MKKNYSENRGFTTPEISIKGVSKSFVGTQVLENIDLKIVPGEIHGILGENGAGKSTLLKILGGAISPDMGSVKLNDEEVQLNNPRDAITLGISLVSQELALIPDRSVLENVFLGRWASRFSFATKQKDRDRFEDLLNKTGFELDADQLVRELSIGLSQQVEILKILVRNTKVLCLDEPTAVLNDLEKKRLLDLLRRLAASGTTVILVSHFLEEVLSIADRVTVLRDGALISTDPVQEHTKSTLIKLMIGRDIDVLFPSLPKKKKVPTATLR